MNRWLEIQKLGEALRWLGAIILFAAAVTFMFEGWQTFSSGGRYLVFLAYLAFVAGLGVFLGWRAKEEKGARTALGIAVACVPVQFSQLGALVHSLVAQPAKDLPSLMVYQATSWMQVLVFGVATVAILTPIAIMGFSALIRAKAGPITLTYLLSCLVLLVPSRDALTTGMLLVALTIFLLWMDATHLGWGAHATTPEGIMARLFLVIPLGILVVRSLFYPAEALFAGATLIAMGVASFEILPRVVREQLVHAIQGWSTLAIAAGWLVAVHDLAPQVRAQGALVTLLPIAGILLLCSLRAAGHRRVYRQAAAWVGLAAVTINLVLSPSVVASFLCVAVSALTVALGYAFQERAIFLAGGAGLIFGLGYHLRLAITLYHASPWAFLAVTGVVMLAVSSYVEKHSTMLLARMVHLRETLRAWS